MDRSGKTLYIVEESALPEVFLRVCRAKELLQTGAAANANEAAAMAGISRSAFYKYRSAVMPFRDMRRGRVLTLSVIVLDRPGTLSEVLAVFADCHANVLTINQSIPVNGMAVVTLSVATEEMTVGADALRQRVEELGGVIRLELVAGQ